MKFTHKNSEKRTTKSDLWLNGITIRDLTTNRGAGFVIQLLDGAGSDAKIVTAIRQPGHSEVVIDSRPTTYVHHPQSELEYRYYPSGKPEPMQLEAVTSRLNQLADEHNALAYIALRHLA